jgi:hypothetical protein
MRGSEFDLGSSLTLTETRVDYGKSGPMGIEPIKAESPHRVFRADSRGRIQGPFAVSGQAGGTRRGATRVQREILQLTPSFIRPLHKGILVTPNPRDVGISVPCPWSLMK